VFNIDQPFEDAKDAEFIQLYSKLARTLGVFGVVGQSPSALLSVHVPGIVIPTSLDPNDPETEYYLSNLLNAALECNYVVTPKAGTVSDVYKLILDGKETPLIDLTERQKMELREAERYLIEPGERFTPAYEAYIACAEVFFAAQDTLLSDEATYKNGGPEVPPAVRQRYEDALSNWRENGNKETVENALAIIRQLQARDPYIYWQALADRFRRHTEHLRNGSEFQRIDSLPRFKEWFRDEAWAPFVFDERDYHHQDRSGGTGMHGQCRCCCCEKVVESAEDLASAIRLQVSNAAWKDHRSMLVAMGPELAPIERRQGVVAGEMTLSCFIKRVTIVRKWMDTAVFYSRFWKWSPQSIGRGIVISTGGSVMGNKIATGVLPVLPTTAIIAKDIEVSIRSEDALKWLQQKIEMDHTIRFGPFLLNAVHAAYREDGFGKVIQVGSAVGAPQLLGFISTIFDKCPNPDPLVPWPS
jgi:hypothetical protein